MNPAAVPMASSLRRTLVQQYIGRHKNWQYRVVGLCHNSIGIPKPNSEKCIHRHAQDDIFRQQTTKQFYTAGLCTTVQVCDATSPMYAHSWCHKFYSSIF